MGVFLVFATSDLTAKVAATCSSFYMPFGHLAVVSYGGSAEELARRLNIEETPGPGAAARCFTTRRGLAMLAAGALALISAIEIVDLLI